MAAAFLSRVIWSLHVAGLALCKDTAELRCPDQTAFFQSVVHVARGTQREAGAEAVANSKALRRTSMELDLVRGPEPPTPRVSWHGRPAMHHGQLGVQLVPRPSHAVKEVYAPAPHNLAPQGLGYGPLRPPRSAPGSSAVLRPALRPSVAGTRPKGCPPSKPDQGVFEEVDDAFDAAFETFSGGGSDRGQRTVIRYGDEYSAKDDRWDGGSEDEEEAISAGRWRNRGGDKGGGQGKRGKGAGKDRKGRGRGRGIGSEVLDDPWAELVAGPAPHLRAHLDGLVDDLESEEEVDEAKARKEAEAAERDKLTEDVKKFRAAVSAEPEPREEEEDAEGPGAAEGEESEKAREPTTSCQDPALELGVAADDAGTAGGGTSIYDFFHDDDDPMI